MQDKDGILALDFGTKKVGLAISHGFMAEALYSVLYRTKEEEFFKKIGEIVDEQEVSKIVIGLPLEDGKESRQSQWTREQAIILSKKVDAKIEFVDEAFTTVEAIDKLKGGSDVDSESARIILEQYLQETKR